MTPTADAAESRAVSQIRVRALFFLVLAIAAGGGAVWLVKRYLDRLTPEGPKGVATVPVVVAAVDVPIAVRLGPKQVAVVPWPKDHVPAGSFRDTSKVIDQTVQQSLVKGEPILQGRLADESEGRGLAALLADGMRAMAVKVDSVVGVAGFIAPGDYVDVITTMTPDQQSEELVGDEVAKISKIILQNVLVLAIGQHLSTEGSKAVKVQVVTLGVTPEESEKVALASHYGHITLTLRSRIDQKLAATAGVAPINLLAPDEDVGKRIEPEQPRRTFRAPRPIRPAEPAKPAAPVVEILRGGKVEERTLRVNEPNP